MSETRAGHDDGPHAHVGASKTSDSETVESEIDSKEEGEIWQLYEQVVPKAGDAQSHETTMEAMPTQDAAAHLPEQFNSQPFRFLDLPIELRLDVYSFFPITARRLRISNHRTGKSYHEIRMNVYPVSILLTCRTIYEESKDIVRVALDDIIATPLELTMCNTMATHIGFYCILENMHLLKLWYTEPLRFITSSNHLAEWAERAIKRSSTSTRLPEARNDIWDDVKEELGDAKLSPAAQKVLYRHLRQFGRFLDVHYKNNPSPKTPDCDIHIKVRKLDDLPDFTVMFLEEMLRSYYTCLIAKVSPDTD